LKPQILFVSLRKKEEKRTALVWRDKIKIIPVIYA
jgi:hypothetical protein